MIPARVMSEWARLRSKKLASVWAPACQDSSHVGNAGVGVISMKGAPLALPTFTTAQFRSFFILVGQIGVCSLLVQVVSCTWWFCMVIKGLIMILSSLL